MASATSQQPDPTTVVVVTGGDEPGPAERAATIPAGAPVVAADSGILRAWQLGLTVTVAVGDFDSVTDADLAAVAAAGGRIDRRPRAKDHTDLELALACARDLRPERIVVLGGHGGRVDHFLANILALSAPALAGVDVEARMGTATLTVVRRRAALSGETGDLLSLIPVHGPAHGVTTTGLAYPLHGESLAAGSTRSVSNELAAPEATVALDSGVLVAVQPGIDHQPTHPRPGGPLP